jgi:hypothetical protein
MEVTSLKKMERLKEVVVELYEEKEGVVFKTTKYFELKWILL